MSIVFDTLRFCVDDIELVARVSGPQDGIPVIALHGWLDNALSFDAIAERQSTWRLVALDLPGHGHSGHKPASGSYGIWKICAVFSVSPTSWAGRASRCWPIHAAR